MVGFVAARKGKTLSVLRDSKVDKGEIYDDSVGLRFSLKEKKDFFTLGWRQEGKHQKWLSKVSFYRP